MAVAVDETSTYDAPPVPPELWARLDEIDRLRERATPGEWEYDADRGVVAGEDDLVAELFNESWVNGTAIDGEPTQYHELLPADDNGALITALHNAWPEVSAHLRRLAGRNLDLEATVCQHQATISEQAAEIERLRAALRDLLPLAEAHVSHCEEHGGYDPLNAWAAEEYRNDTQAIERARVALAEGSE